MQLTFSYDKKKTLQALRYHFISRIEIKIMMILVNVFAIVAAALFYTHKIRPEPFLLGSIIWLIMMLGVWYVLPYSIYNKANTFKETFTIFFSEREVKLNSDKGYVQWPWNTFVRYFESPHFFHLYFDAKSFFLVPKEDMTEEMKHDLRGLFNERINK
ncbi:MAG: YcxB family protein [Pedobacter sp.]|nr:YcxB family protein [Chitinophagaceae bacterium]